MAAKGEKTGFRGAVRRWDALCVVCAFLGLFAVADYRIKRAGEGLGFHPSGAACVVVSQNLPAFCARVAATDAAARFTDETPRPFDAFELAVRKATGIRPTPLRWRVWLGPRFVWARLSPGGSSSARTITKTRRSGACMAGSFLHQGVAERVGRMNGPRVAPTRPGRRPVGLALRSPGLPIAGRYRFWRAAWASAIVWRTTARVSFWRLCTMSIADWTFANAAS